MPFAKGQLFDNKVTGHRYEIYDVIGQGGAVPSETPVLFLKLTSKSSFFAFNAQQFITFSGREFLNYFEPARTR